MQTFPPESRIHIIVLGIGEAGKNVYKERSHPRPPGCISRHVNPPNHGEKSLLLLPTGQILQGLWEGTTNTEEMQPQGPCQLTPGAHGADASLSRWAHTHTHTHVYPSPSPGHSAKGLVVALQLCEQVISCHLCPSKGTDPDRKFPTKYESPQSFFSLSLSTWCHHRRRQLCQSK